MGGKTERLCRYAEKDTGMRARRYDNGTVEELNSRRGGGSFRVSSPQVMQLVVYKPLD
jgi:hypothetical protein